MEKFVTVKLSLFVDSSSLRDFLRRDWERAESQLGSVPSDTMVKLGAVLSELADILDNDLAAKYLPLIGDMRKVKGASIASVLTSQVFDLERDEHAHDQFWRVLVNQSHDFTSALAQGAIETLIEYLPRYSAFENDDRALRQRSIYSLLRLLDRAGWGRTSGRRRPNGAESVIDIAWRILGEHAHQGRAY